MLTLEISRVETWAALRQALATMGRSEVMTIANFLPSSLSARAPAQRTACRFLPSAVLLTVMAATLPTFAVGRQSDIPSAAIGSVRQSYSERLDYWYDVPLYQPQAGDDPW